MKVFTLYKAIFYSLALSNYFLVNPLLAKGDKVKKSGKIEVLYEEYTDGSHKLRHNLITDDGERISLKLDLKKEHKFQTGQKVELEGQFIDDNILVLGAENGPTYGTTPGIMPNTYGEQKTLVMMINFQDSASEPWTKEDVAASFELANNFFQEVSYGKTWLNVTITDWMTLPISGETCQSSEFTKLAREHATSLGYDITNYDRLIYNWPAISDCRWGGLGTVGGSPSRAWFNGGGILTKSVLNHELGHNLGLYHTHELICDGTTLGDNCSIKQYGNRADTMGAGSGHFNTYQKDRLGWLDSKVLTVTQSGTFQIAPHEFSSDRPLAIRVLKGFNSEFNSNDWYYLEFRQPIGFDTILGNSFYDSHNWTDAVTIHTGNEKYGDYNYLLDMNPETTGSHDASLNVGQTYIDELAGITITTNWTNQSGAEVSITLDNSQNNCIQSVPSISFTNNQNSAIAGTSLAYSLSISNNDSEGCSSRAFSLSALAPTGWTTTFSNNSLTIPPGESLTTTLIITSAESSTSGSYDIPVKVSSGESSVSGLLTYIIEEPVINSPPLANNDSASTTKDTSVTVDVLSNDSDPDGDKLSIISASSLQGSIFINSSGTITFTPTSEFSGDAIVNYSISDGRGETASAKVYITVQELPDTTKPTVTILSPSNGEVVSSGQQVVISADAQDNKGISKVEFIVNNITLFTDTTAPYSFIYEIPKGKVKTFAITVRATDTSALQGSANITIGKSETTASGQGGGKGNGKGGKK